MNTVVLDVAIGLILIYVLYSLLASTVSELIAITFSYRQRMLEISLEQMLDGKNISYYWWDKLINILGWPISFLYYIYKTLKIEIGLKIINAKEKKINKNYANNHNLTKALVKINKVKQPIKESKQSNIDKIKTIAKRKVYLKKGTEPIGFRWKLNKKARFFASEITSHPLYLRSSEDTWLNKKPAYLPASVFSDILIDVFKPIRNEFALLKDIKIKIDHDNKINPQTKNILNIYVEQANGDLQRFKLLIENWYDETQKRVSGWYKRQSYWVLLIIGFILAISFNISTIDIVKKLSNNPDLSKSLADNATEIIKNKQLVQDDTLQETAKESLKKIASLRKDYIDNTNSLLGAGWDFSKINTTVSWYDFPYLVNSKKYTEYYFQIKSVITRTFSDFHLWLGFLITAFAISLGAPFWFDLLNKFVNLRVAGQKPVESPTSQSVVNKTDSLNKKPDPAAKG